MLFSLFSKLLPSAVFITFGAPSQCCFHFFWSSLTVLFLLFSEPLHFVVFIIFGGPPQCCFHYFRSSFLVCRFHYFQSSFPVLFSLFSELLPSVLFIIFPRSFPVLFLLFSALLLSVVFTIFKLFIIIILTWVCRAHATNNIMSKSHTIPAISSFFISKAGKVDGVKV